MIFGSGGICFGAGASSLLFLKPFADLPLCHSRLRGHLYGSLRRRSRQLEQKRLVPALRPLRPVRPLLPPSSALLISYFSRSYLSALIALPTSLLALHRALRHVPSSHPRNLTGTVITPHRPRDLIIVDNDDDGGGRGGGETWQDVSTVPVSAPVVDSGPASASGGVRRSAATVEGVQVLREVLVACEEEMRAAAAEEGEKVKGEEEIIEEV